jgi:hypothetical protein
MVSYVTIKIPKPLADSLKNEIQNIVKDRHRDLKYLNLSYTIIIYWMMERYKE